MSSLFADSRLSEAFDKAHPSDEGAMATAPSGYMTEAEDVYDAFTADNKAKERASMGKSVEDLDQEMIDPRYEYKVRDYERNLDEYNKRNRIGRYEVPAEEIERLRSQGHPENEILRLTPAPEDQRGEYPQMPTERVTRRELREEFGIPFGGIDQPKAPMSELDITLLQNEMIHTALNPQAPMGIMAAPEIRQEETRNQANMVSAPYEEANRMAAEKTNPMNAESQNPGRVFLMKFIGKE